MMNSLEKQRFEVIKETYPYILDLINDGSTILDLGCGEGHLMQMLQDSKHCRCQGIEMNSAHVNECVKKGLFVYNDDLNEGLEDYPDRRFDYVILSDVIQTLPDCRKTLLEATRVGKKAIVTTPNFGNIFVRLQLLFTGKMPKNKSMPYEWYNTPNIHFSSFADFIELCRNNGITIEKEFYLAEQGSRQKRLRVLPNLRGNTAIYVVSREVRNE
ncbi:MAG: methionine biosynthesis protein MetW [Abditibacteriota bacterium]|nr:methionine biosynthesis protein MetW [Abditibacteriota bacterium]